VIASPAGDALLGQIRERSTAAFAEISTAASTRARPTPASVVAATSGAPRGRGAMLRVASDLPAQVEFEVSLDPSFRDSRRLDPRRTNSFHGAFGRAGGLPPGRRVWWRARLRRRGRTTVGPVRSFTTPARHHGATTVAVAACASQFGPIFDRIAAVKPDVFLWQGDLNYPDTIGPLAQTGTGYAGIWRDFLANPRLGAMLEHTLFAVQRDDHDYGRQDANSTDLAPWGIHPWEGLMESRRHYRFRAGPAEFWVLDERRHKSDPSAPDTRSKTLLGARQRDWLMRTLAASKARFKVICSPCTLAPLSANERDGSWAAGFTAERDFLLRHIRRHVGGRTLFITGDTHWTMVYERDGLFEARPCPLGIPVPNDITLSDPNAAADARSVPGVAYADDRHGHFALVRVEAARAAPRLPPSLVREDGAIVYRRRFGSGDRES
jgi:phosphodiesterase/alkaline phosphatase D-like protein